MTPSCMDEGEKKSQSLDPSRWDGCKAVGGMYRLPYGNHESDEVTKELSRKKEKKKDMEMEMEMETEIEIFGASQNERRRMLI